MPEVISSIVTQILMKSINQGISTATKKVNKEIRGTQRDIQKDIRGGVKDLSSGIFD